METGAFMDWFAARRAAHTFEIRPIPFSKLRGWDFEEDTGNLRHESGKFFSIEGIRVRTNFGPVAKWSQPIINQPEVGILGILTKKFDGILHFLMQVKMEPGNINMVQLAPTLQATRSNYTRVHQGKAPPYLDYFLDKAESRVLVDALQSEQGARFLRKRNRNVIIETERDVSVQDDFCWLTLGQLHKLAQQDNLINMDARTVLAAIPFAGSGGGGGAFQQRLLRSALDTECALHDTDTLVSWLTELKVRYELDVERIPLKQVQGWTRHDDAIRHEAGKYFSVIAVSVEADNREVPRWTQPLVKPQEEGIVAYIVKPIHGVLHFLVQAKVEPGNFDIVEIAPTVQCITGSYRQAPAAHRPAFLDYVLAARPEQIRSCTHQSEEGGRFYRETNRNMIIEVGEDFPIAAPENYTWMTMHQLKEFIKYNNFLNVEARCLLSCLGFL